MKIRTETKEILFAVFLFCIAGLIALSMLSGMSGCTTVTTKDQAKEIIKPIYEAGKEIYIEEKEKLKDETKITDITVTNGSNNNTVDNTVSPVVETGEGKKEEINKAEDAFPLSDLTFNIAVDNPQLANHFTGFQNQSHPWALMKDLPVTVIIKKFDASGIELDGVPQGQYTEKGWERTSTFWAFDENGVELGYEDHAYTSYEQPGKFYGKAKYILVVRCSDIQAIARSRVLKVN